jgi:receptor protein-tyrosine kinase
VTHAVERLEAVDAELTGVVINMVPAKGRRGGYGYGYGYGYAPDAVSKSSPRSAAASRGARRKER